MTLLCFWGEQGPNYYEVPDPEMKPYGECHGCMLNYNDQSKPDIVGQKTEHLAYMLGEEEWYDATGVPSLSDFLERVNNGGETADPLCDGKCDPPWAKFKVEVPNFSRVSKLIICGWAV